ncbi:MAG: hypothetical protein IJC30_04335 [Alphaproteobacteria bacterium]|nr:hypothetical protein [Alphaproteobacteria bacterium]
MKKILLGTVFGFMCLGVPLYVSAQENEMQPNVVAEELPTDEIQENAQEITDGAEPMEEEQNTEGTESKISPEDKAFLDTVLKLFVPDYRDEMGKTSITKDGKDYVVTLPMIGEIRCVRIEDLNGYAQYQTELPTIPVMRPLLGEVQMTNLKNTVRFVPEFGVVSYQDTTAQEILSDKGLSFKDFVAKRNISEKTDKMIDVKTFGSLSQFLFDVPPYLKVAVASIKGESELENTRLSDEVLMPLDAQKGSYETEIKGFDFATMLFPVEKVNLNLKTEVEYINKNDIYESEVDIAVSDINVVLKDKVLESKMPTYIDFETDAAGFTKEAVLKVYEASKTASLEPGNQALARVAVEEINKMAQDVKLDIEKLAFGNENYDVVLSGKAQVFETYTDFDGKLSIRGFDFISPEPTKIDEAVCEKEKKAMQELVSKSSEGSFSLDYIAQFEKQKEAVQKACVAEENLLDDLRPFIKTAQKEKDDKGREILVFDIKTNENETFINGEKSEKLSLKNEE